MPEQDARNQKDKASSPKNGGDSPEPADAGLTQQQQPSQPAAQYGGYGQGKEALGRAAGSDVPQEGHEAGGASADAQASHGHGGSHQQMAGADSYQASERYGGYASEQRDMPGKGTDSVLQGGSRQDQASAQGVDPSGYDTQAGVSSGSSHTAKGAAIRQAPDPDAAQSRTPGAAAHALVADRPVPPGNASKGTESKNSQ